MKQVVVAILFETVDHIADDRAVDTEHFGDLFRCVALSNKLHQSVSVDDFFGYRHFVVFHLSVVNSSLQSRRKQFCPVASTFDKEKAAGLRRRPSHFRYPYLLVIDKTDCYTSTRVGRLSML